MKRFILAFSAACVVVLAVRLLGAWVGVGRDTLWACWSGWVGACVFLSILNTVPFRVRP